MAVRFLPPPEEASVAPVRDRGDLAEVIDLRTRLARRSGPVVVSELVATPERGEGESAPFESASFDSAPFESVPFDSAPTDADEAEAAESAPVDEPVRSASEDGVRLLARRARSSGELRRELLELGHAAEEVELLLADFERSLYLDDLGLARVLTENLRGRKRASRSQIRAKLRERLLPDRIIEQALGELDEGEEQELLRQTAEDRARRLAGLDRQTAERRLLGFLARRGWSGERASRVAREALDAAAARGTVRFR